MSQEVQSVILRWEEADEEWELELHDIQPNGRGRLSWAAVEKAFRAEVMIADRKVPTLFESGNNKGLTRTTFQPGVPIQVKIRGEAPDGKWSLQELLYTRLPPPRDSSGSSQSKRDRDTDRETHPTAVEEWPQWEVWAKDAIERGTTGWQQLRYDRVGETTGECISSESGAVALLDATACGRVNVLFGKHGINYRFTIHSPIRPSDSEVAERSHGRTQREPEEVRGRDHPDICLVERSGAVREIKQTTECKTKFRLAGVETSSMATIWNAWVKHSVAQDADIAHNVVQVIAQELGYMSRRGHKTGIISTYFHTWLLQTDGLGRLKISPAIRHDTLGTPTTVSVTEVFLCSALSNIYDHDAKAYPTAKKPSEQPISWSDLDRRIKQAQDDLTPKGQQPEVGSTGRAYNTRSTSRPIGELHLTTRLAPNVFLGGVSGTVAAVRLATSPAAVQDAIREAAVYERLEHLQGRCVPRLLAHGLILEGSAYYVATEYIEGQAWDWNARSHQALDQDLQRALGMIHEAGIMHGDLHKRNILVTPDDRIIILDFEGSQMHADPKQMATEMRDVTSLQAKRVALR